MMSINFKLAYDSFRRNKHDTTMLVILGVIVFTLLVSIANIATTYHQALNQKELKDNGKWLYYQEAVDYSFYRETVLRFDDVATIENVGLISDDNSYNIVRLSDNFSELVNTTIIEGAYPQTGQIALSQDLLDSFGYQGKIGETITINYNDLNDNSITVTAKLSGIILNNEISLKYNTLSMTGKITEQFQLVKLGDVILPPETVSSKTVSMFVYDQKLTTDVQSDNFYSLMENRFPIVYNYRLYTNNGYTIDAASQFSAQLFFLGVCLAVGAICLTLMLGITLSSLQRRTREFTLLRAIGQTKKQLFKMLLSQLLLFVVLAIIIAVPLIILITYLGTYLIRKYIFIAAALLLNPALILGMIIVGVLIIFVGMFIPSYQASKKSLSGAFDEQTFKYFEVRYKKLYYQNPLQLAKRQLVKNIKLNFILIIILTITFNSMNNLIMSYRSYQDNQQAYNQVLKNNEIKITVEGGRNGLTKKQIDELEILQDQVYYGKSGIGDQLVYSWDSCEKSPFIENGYVNTYNYNNQTIIDSWIKFNAFSKDSTAYQEISKYVEGHMPEANNEIVVYLPYYRIVEGNAVLGNTGNRYDDTIKSDSILSIYLKDNNLESSKNHQFVNEYKVVGIIRELPNNNLIDFDLISIIVTETEFNHTIYETNTYNNIYIKANDQTVTLSKLNQFNNENLIINTYSDEYKVQEMILNNELEQKIIIFMFLISLSIFLFAYLAKYRVINNSQIIGTLKSIGMTNFQLYRFYSYQSLILCLGALLLSCYIVIYNIYTNILGLSELGIYLFSVFIMSLLIMVIYCIPLRKILKKEPIDLIKIRE